MTPMQLGSKNPREVTGRMVLISVIAFFAVVVAVNLTMATLAVSTFGGVETRNAYQAGLSFSREIASAHAQETRDWHVDAKLSPWTPDGVTIEVFPKDAGGVTIGDVEVSIAFSHPANRQQDRVVTLSPFAVGAYRGRAAVGAGQWDLVLEITRDGERLFRSKSRIHLR